MRADGVFDRLVAVEGRWYRVVFFLVVFAYVLATLREAVGYTPSARLFPLVVGTATAALLGLEIAATVTGRGRLRGPFAGVFDQLGAGSDRTPDRYRREVRTLAWLVGLVGVVYLVGHLLGAFVYVTAFIRARGGSWRRALAVGAGTTAGLYVLFELLLTTPLYEGLVRP